MIDAILMRHHRVLIIVGSGESALTKRNPLPADVRIEMIQQAYPRVSVRSLADHPSDATWSTQLDALIKSIYPYTTTGNEIDDPIPAIVYGGRDNNMGRYSGMHPVVVLDEIHIPQSGTHLRESIIPSSTYDFRAGMIHAANHRFPTSYQTVDMVVTKHDARFPDRTWVLMGRKKRQEDPTKMVFPGGFVDPADESLERAAQRELREEVGDIEVSRPKYLGSFRSNDWRYRTSEDKIMSAVYHFEYIFGAVRASDDLIWCDWVDLTDLPSIVSATHKPIVEMYLRSLGGK